MGYAQNGEFTFPTDCKPEIVSATDAALEASNSQSKCGFGSVYFSAADIKELMAVNRCVGLRFYIAMERADQKFADVVGVAINTNGREIGDFLEKKYHMAKALDAHFPHNFIKTNRKNAKAYVDNLTYGPSKLDPYVGYLGIDRLNSLITQVGSDGIRIYPAEYEKEGDTFRTMSFGAVKLKGKDIEDMGTDYLEGRLPCPVDCGGDGERNYLWNR